MSAKDKIAKGRTGLVLDNPFWGSLALRLEVVEDPNCNTMATDGRKLLYGSEFVDSLSQVEVKAVLAHEVMHCALGHPARLKGREHARWNVACDYAINPILTDAGFKLPEGVLLDMQYRDMSADDIYAALPNDQKNQSESDGTGQGGQGGTPEPGKSGSPGMIGDVIEPKHDDGSAMSDSESRQLEQEWKVAMAQAANAAKAAGNLPGMLERLVDELVNPRVNWVEILRRFVDAYARNDYAMFPPNRRFVSQGLYLPSARSEELGSICAVMDTSGSVDNATVCQFASELQDIAFHYRTDTTVIHCDRQVQEVEYFPVDTEIELHPKGGGGTDFRPPFAEVEDRGDRPACLIYFTDGACSRFPDDPGYPVLWAIYGRYSNADTFRPPFGEVVAI